MSHTIEHLIERHGWTHGQAAEFLGVERSQVSRWVSSGSEPGVVVRSLIGVGCRMSCALAAASIGLGVQGEPVDALVCALGRVRAARLLYSTKGRGRPAVRPLARLAAVVSLAAALEPGALEGL